MRPGAPFGPGSRAPHEAASASSPKASIPSAGDLPTVLHEGIIRLGAMEIKVLHLSNGERVIEEEALRELLSVLFDESSEGNGV